MGSGATPAGASSETNGKNVTNLASTIALISPTDFFFASPQAGLSDHELEIGGNFCVTVIATYESVDYQFFNCELTLTDEGDVRDKPLKIGNEP